MFPSFPRVIFYLFVLVFFAGITGCKKDKKLDQLIGTWDFVFLSSADSNKTHTWTFYEGYQLIQSRSLNNISVIDTASYLMEKEFMDGNYLTVSGLNQYTDGKYKILRLNKSFLVIERIESADGGAAFLRFEFVKK